MLAWPAPPANSAALVSHTDCCLARRGSGVYTRHVATTGTGHVIVAADMRHGPVRGGTYHGVLAKYNGATGSSVWVHDFNEGEVCFLFQLQAVGETAYLTGSLKGSYTDPFNTGTYVTSSDYGGEYDAFIASLDVSGASGFVANWVVKVGPGRGRSVTVVGEHLYVAGSCSNHPQSADHHPPPWESAA